MRSRTRRILREKADCKQSTICLLFYTVLSLRGRRSKGKGKGIRARDHARGRREEGNACKDAILGSISPILRSLSHKNSSWNLPRQEGRRKERKLSRTPLPIGILRYAELPAPRKYWG